MQNLYNTLYLSATIQRCRYYSLVKIEHVKQINKLRLFLLHIQLKQTFSLIRQHLLVPNLKSVQLNLRSIIGVVRLYR